MWITTLLCVIFTALLVWIIRDRKRRLSRWKSLGIPGPEPHLLWGNIQNFRKEGPGAVLEKWQEQYGDLVGYYEGPRAILLTRDLEIAKEVLVKNFHKFHSRKTMPLLDPDAEHANMVRTQGERWKLQRSVCSPTFTAIRMKEMSPLVNQGIDALMELFSVRCAEGVPFDIHWDFQRLTLTVIASCAFGIEIQALKDPNDLFLAQCRSLFYQLEHPPMYLKLLGTLGVIFPSSAPLMRLLIRPLRIGRMRPWLFETASNILQARKNSKDDRRDFVQLLLNSSAEVSEDTNALSMEMEDNNLPEDGATHKTKKKKVPTATLR